MSGFHHESDLPIDTRRMRFVATDPWHFMLVGGWSNWVNADRRYIIIQSIILVNMAGLNQTRRSQGCCMLLVDQLNFYVDEALAPKFLECPLS